jgi:hypothetical protein
VAITLLDAEPVPVDAVPPEVVVMLESPPEPVDVEAVASDPPDEQAAVIDATAANVIRPRCVRIRFLRDEAERQSWPP